MISGLRLTPSAFPRIMEAGQKDYGRSILPHFVEDVINHGKLIDSPIVNGVQRQVWMMLIAGLSQPVIISGEIVESKGTESSLSKG